MRAINPVNFSIITVCYNSQDTIADTLLSVRAQVGVDVEHLIIDGLSKDKTLDVIYSNNYKNMKIVSEPDSGIYDAMNKGIRMAKGDIVGILNADDFYFDENVLREVAFEFDKDPSTEVVFGTLIFVHQKNTNSIVRLYNSKNFKPWKLIFGWMPPHPACFIRRSTYERHGYYRTDFKIASDYDLMVRYLLKEKVKYKYINKVLVKMRLGGVSTASWKSRLLLNKEIVRAVRDNGYYTNLFLVLIKLPFKIIEILKLKKINLTNLLTK